MAVLIKSVEQNSLADAAQLRGGDYLLSIDGNEINDMLDYEFYSSKAEIELSVMMSGDLEYIKLEKEEYEPLGLNFETYLIDGQHSCKNKCMFCFIDQLPKGLRAPLYFKDDDERLSFLFGNYITLTNLTTREVERIKKMRISPINISVHTMNPELRVEMMANKHAGEVLSYIADFAKAGIEMNCQIVLCRGVNDKDYLNDSIKELSAFYPYMRSIAVVPAGLTNHREGLPELIPYDKETSKQVLLQLEKQAAKNLKKYSSRIVFPADEFYLLAEESMPPIDFYEEMLQLENGVGMWRLFYDEFYEALQESKPTTRTQYKVDVITGEASAALIKDMVKSVMEKFSGPEIKVHVVKNYFFGGNVWVTGLLTGKDIISQIEGKLISNNVVLPVNMLRNEQDMLLDDMTPKQLSEALQAEVHFCLQSGGAFLEELLRERK